MPSVFPTSLPDFSEPANPLATPLGDSDGGTRKHSEHHRDLGDELLAVATKVGITSSADTASHDYKIAQLEGAGSGGAVHNSLFDANTMLAATADNTPFALTLGVFTVPGRKSGAITQLPIASPFNAGALVLATSSGDLDGGSPTSIVYASGNISGGVLNNTSGIDIHQTYTVAQDPVGVPIGSPVYIDFNPTMAYAGGVNIGPLYSSGYYGPRALVQIEGKVQYNNSTGILGQAPIGFADQLLVKNQPGTSKNYTPCFSYQATKAWVADSGTVAPNKVSWAPQTFSTGPAAYSDSPLVFTANTGTMNMTSGGDYDLISYTSALQMVGNTTLSVRTAFDVRDTEKANATVLDSVFGTKLSGSVDTATPTLTTQYGVRIPRLAYATNNYGIRCDTPSVFLGDSVSLTTSAQSSGNVPFTVNGTTTLTSSADFVAATFVNSRAWVVDTATNAFSFCQTVADLSTFKSGANATNRDFRYIFSFYTNPTVTADQSDDTLTSYVGYLSKGTFATTGAGTPTLAVTTSTCFSADATAVGANCTVTTRTGLAVSDAAGAGVVTNQYGVDIAALAKAATINVGLRNAAPTVFTPSAVQTLAAGTAVVANATVVMIGTSGVVSTTAAPTIANGSDGQILTILNTAGTSWEIKDQGTLASSNVRLVGTNMVMGPRDSITLVYSATVGDWVEIARSNVT